MNKCKICSKNPAIYSEISNKTNKTAKYCEECSKHRKNLVDRVNLDSEYMYTTGKKVYHDIREKCESNGFILKISAYEYNTTHPNWIPYTCKYNHALVCATRNCIQKFPRKICQECIISDKKSKIMEVMTRIGGKFIKLCKNRIEYVCRCGKISKTTYMNISNKIGCPSCTMKDPDVQNKLRDTNMRIRGVEHPQHDPTVRKKTENTNMRIRGVKYSGQDPKCKQKARETNMKKRGVAFPTQDPLVRQKIKDVVLKTRGVENVSQDPTIKQKKIDTCIRNWGVENPSQYPIVKQKKIDTCIRNWGTKYPAQNAEIFAKSIDSSFKRKSYIFPSGRVDYIQGYEHACLDILLQEYTENQLFTERSPVMPEIWYQMENEVKTRRYYPDIYIPHENLIIEVKSEYTFSHPKFLAKNLAKISATIAAGFKVYLYVFNHRNKTIYLEYINIYPTLMDKDKRIYKIIY